MSKICFVLSPLGAESSEVRRYSDDFWEYLILPTCEKLGYDAIRVDKMSSNGSITRDIIQKLINADLVIADLSYSNPNVMYELGIRHSIGKPTIMMAKKEQSTPFDISTVRTIFYDLTNASDIRNTHKLLINSIQSIEKQFENDSPVIDAELVMKIRDIRKKNYSEYSKEDFSNVEIEASLKTILDRLGNVENSIRIIGSDIEKKDTLEFSRDVFIVHGHDGELKNELARFLEKLNFNPIILHEQPDKGQTILQKLQFESRRVGYAFIIHSPDDEGRKKGTNEELQSRSRQNVIFENGMFVGQFGPERVCAIVKEGVEIPSDLSGVVFKRISKDKGIMSIAIDIITELKAAGYKIDANKIFKEL